MLWFIYNILFLIGFTLLLPKFLWRMKRRGGYARDFGQRFGRYRPEVESALAEGGRIWIHAVSVGELFVGLKVMRAYRNQVPEARFVISTTTSTGYKILQEQVGEGDVGIYFPLDHPWIVRRVLNLLKPRALVLIEGEFWPNLVRAVNRRGIPLFLVNGIMSEHSFRGYRRLRPFARRIFRLFDHLCVQSARDRDRLLALGAPEDRVRVLNSAKYEVAEADPEGEARAAAVLAWAGLGGGRPLLVGGSTWPGEEAVLLDLLLALKPMFPTLGVVLVPRHVERKAEVAAELERRALPFRSRSDYGEGADAVDPVDVLLVDTTGELKHFYPHAGLIFVGKSLCSQGGQNIIEPALFGRPVLVGPHMKNFPVVIEDFLGARALIQVADAEGLREAVKGLLEDPAEAAAMGERAAALVREKSGAIAETVEMMRERIEADRAKIPAKVVGSE